MSHDPTEMARRAECAVLAATAGPREELEKRYGKVYSTDELQAEFSVTGFMAPYVGVTRKSDGKKGSMRFQGSPRFYFEFQPE